MGMNLNLLLKMVKNHLRSHQKETGGLIVSIQYFGYHLLEAMDNLSTCSCLHHFEKDYFSETAHSLTVQQLDLVVT
jgi:hypothetical protein